MGTFVYELLALVWMVVALVIAFDQQTGATFAAGLSIASATLALVHEHRQDRSMRARVRIRTRTRS